MILAYFVAGCEAIDRDVTLKDGIRIPKVRPTPTLEGAEWALSPPRSESSSVFLRGRGFLHANRRKHVTHEPIVDIGGNSGRIGGVPA